jgi:periplasmic divalent cation tolerance protein
MKVVLCNCPPESSTRIAEALVESGAAACVNVIASVMSVYRWEGETVKESEDTLVIKAPVKHLAIVRAEIHALHPYSVPEIVVLDVDVEASASAYVDWVRATPLA